MRGIRINDLIERLQRNVGLVYLGFLLSQHAVEDFQHLATLEFGDNDQGAMTEEIQILYASEVSLAQGACSTYIEYVDLESNERRLVL